jgi:hypothetical protein
MAGGTAAPAARDLGEGMERLLLRMIGNWPLWLALMLSGFVSVLTSLYFGHGLAGFLLRVLVNFALYYIVILALRWVWRKVYRLFRKEVTIAER